MSLDDNFRLTIEYLMKIDRSPENITLDVLPYLVRLVCLTPKDKLILIDLFEPCMSKIRAEIQIKIDKEKSQDESPEDLIVKIKALLNI